MKYLYLVWKSIWRKKARTILTILSVVVAFFLFGILSAVNQAFTGGADLANASRLVVIDKVSLVNSLPASYLQKIETIPGVEHVVHQDWFGGYYQDQRQQFAQMPTDIDRYFAVFPEILLPDDQKEAWRRTQDGIVIGREIADRYGLSIGDRMPIHSTIWTNKDGGQVWDFQVVGIFDHADPKQSTQMALFSFKYFDEGRAFGTGSYGWFTISLASGADPVEVAAAVDAQFANSRNETKTSTEAAFVEAFTAQLGNIALIVTLILSAVFFTILLVAGNTMAQSVRERISELAVLKTLGFQDGSVLGIVLAESVLIMLLGGLVGLGAAWVIVSGAPAMGGLPPLYIPGDKLLVGLGYMVGAGLLAGLFPAWQAKRLTIIDALARA